MFRIKKNGVDLVETHQVFDLIKKPHKGIVIEPLHDFVVGLQGQVNNYKAMAQAAEDFNEKLGEFGDKQELLAKIDGLEQELEKIKAERENYKNSQNHYKRETKRLKLINEGLELDNNHLRSGLEDKKQSEVICAQNSTGETSIAELQARITSLENQVHEITEANTSLFEENKYYRAEIDMLRQVEKAFKTIIDNGFPTYMFVVDMLNSNLDLYQDGIYQGGMFNYVVERMKNHMLEGQKCGG